MIGFGCLTQKDTNQKHGFEGSNFNPEFWLADIHCDDVFTGAVFNKHWFLMYPKYEKGYHTSFLEYKD